MLTPSEKRAIADLQGSLPSNDADPDEIVPDTIDVEHLRECTNGDDAFIEELQESLRPL